MLARRLPRRRLVLLSSPVSSRRTVPSRRGISPVPRISGVRADRVSAWRPMPHTPYPHSLQMEEEVLEGALEGAASYTWFRLKFVVVSLSDPNPPVLIFEQ